jgi:SOS-response transcriptional repressor LexA
MKSSEQFNKIVKFASSAKRAPTITEICKLFKYASRSSAHKLILKLEREKFLYRDSSGKIIMPGVLDMPLEFIGVVHAGKTIGFPNPAEEETAEVLTLEELLTVDNLAAKLFRVQGDSMIDAGIYEDDILLVECTDKWRSGDIVIAEYDGDVTVKYIQKDKNGKTFLQPANADMKNIYPEEYMKVLAVVRNVIRCYGKRT